MKFITTLAVVMVSFSASMLAQTERDLGSHEHGSAALNIALDTDSVFIELDTPWNNIVGFEHAPTTPDQQTLLEDALTLISEPEKLFSFEGAECVVFETSLENSFAQSGGDEHGEGHGDEHDEGHDDEHSEGHGDEHDEGHDDEADTHASILAIYSFNCNNLGKLDAIQVDLLEIWSGFEALDVQLIGPGGQASMTVNAQQNRLDVRQIR